MSGIGKRFVEAGYKDPKPLIQVENKTIIEPKLIEIEQIDKQYFRELEGRFNDIKDDLEELKKGVLPFWNSYDRQLNNLFAWGSLTEHEKDELRELELYRKEKSAEFSKELTSFDHRFKKMGNSISQQKLKRP